MGRRVLMCLLLVVWDLCTATEETNAQDGDIFLALVSGWNNKPSNWVGADPCTGAWVGIKCNGSRITSMELSSMGLEGSLTGDIGGLTELQIVDLSYNVDMTGSLPSNIGKLTKLTDLILLGCNFIGAIPDLSGLQELTKLGVLENGQLVAVKRAEQRALQGGMEFKTEIELLSRVHHRNLVMLVGFSFDKGEQMLVYEYIPNGNLKESLSGKSGVRLDWRRRLRVALGSARGLAYLHELADPPIVHRDVKSNNILLDDHLLPKVSDFGLCKSLGDGQKTHVTTQVKGTMGYLDPEYYMSQQLTEKSDVYSFGVVMLELVTARQPIERGRYIVREVKLALNRSEDLCGLHELLDANLVSNPNLLGFEKFIDLALRCLDELGENRPTMSEVVKEIEAIMQLVGINPNTDSAASSASYGESSTSKHDPHHPYSNEGMSRYDAMPVGR